jgi:threonine dehydratase
MFLTLSKLIFKNIHDLKNLEFYLDLKMIPDKQEKASYETVVKAYNRLGPILTKTPVHTNSTFNQLVGRKVYFKCENFQKTGSFKARGALNAVIVKLVETKDSITEHKGCATHSTGNHGTALAWACNNENIPCTVVLPSDTPYVKIASVKNYNANVVFCAPNPVSRVNTCNKVSEEQSLKIIKPYDDYDVISGQGTVAYEFLDQIPELDAIFVSVSGGGLISGIALYAKHVKPTIKIFAVEPVGKRLSKCLETNKRNLDDKLTAFLNTKAEGIRTEQCGELTFPIIRDNVNADDVFTVSDEEMIEATRFVFERMKMVIELSAGAAVAAAKSSKFIKNYPEVQNVGIILCGGNIDVNKLPW